MYILKLKPLFIFGYVVLIVKREVFHYCVLPKKLSMARFPFDFAVFPDLTRFLSICLPQSAKAGMQWITFVILTRHCMCGMLFHSLCAVKFVVTRQSKRTLGYSQYMSMDHSSFSYKYASCSTNNKPRLCSPFCRQMTF